MVIVNIAILIIIIIIIIIYFIFFQAMSSYNMTNNSLTGTSFHDPLERSISKIGLEVTLSILICLTSFLDNLLVVYVVHKDSRLKSLTYIFIHNLALSDISMASLYMPFWVTNLYTGTWIFSETWCEFQGAILGTLAIASALNMGLIAFNRYIRVVKPELYSRLFPSKRVARLYCALVWIASLLLATPPLYGWGKIVYHPLFTACCFDWKFENISYAIVIVGIVFNGTTVSIFHFYYNIYKTLKESTQNLNAHSMEDRVASSGRPETDIRLLKTSFTVVCVFLMTWGPISFVVLLETAGCSIPREVFMASMYLMFSSSLVNPIIYGIMNPQFRAAFKRALTFRGYSNNQICHGSRWNGIKPSRQPWSLGMRAPIEPRGLAFF